MRRAILPLCLFIALNLTACGALLPSFLQSSNDDTNAASDESPLPSDTPAISPTLRFALPLGGVAPGRDELVLYADDDTVRDLQGHTLRLFVEPTDIIGFTVRPGADDYADGSGARITPLAVGTAMVRATIDRTPQPERYAVIVPPQSLVQVLIGEARGVLAKDATVVDGVVTLDSRSVVGEAIGAVIRNRIALIDAAQRPGLFAADPIIYNRDDPAAHYDAVITAQTFSLYQFSPVHPDDPSHEAYTLAEARQFLPPRDQIAYDQAALTAAGIFDGAIADPTNGAFGFRTPTTAEYDCLQEALRTQPSTLLAACGPMDTNFPALAPIQILIHPEVRLLADGRPAFVFYRTRNAGDPVVTDVP